MSPRNCHPYSFLSTPPLSHTHILISTELNDLKGTQCKSPNLSLLWYSTLFPILQTLSPQFMETCGDLSGFFFFAATCKFSILLDSLLSGITVLCCLCCPKPKNLHFIYFLFFLIKFFKVGG